MQSILQNKILHKNKFILCLIGLFIFVTMVFAAPFSVTLSTDSDFRVSGSIQIANAAESGLSETTAPKSKTGLGKTANQLEEGTIEYFIYSLCVGIGGFFLWIGGMLLDTAVGYLVVGMGDILGSDKVGAAIGALWTVIRDIFNLFFIFGLIFIGFKTILFTNDSSSKRALGTLLIAALLINFSLYFTKVIVDFSNIAAVEVYNLIEADKPYKILAGTVGVKGVAALFMSETDLASFADPKGGMLNDVSNLKSSTSYVITYGFMLMIFMLIASFVFASGAIILISRFIAIIIFLIFSPAMFLGMIYPGFASYANKWWSKFLANAFVAPAFLFMLYLSLVVLNTLDLNGGSTFAEVGKASASDSPTITVILSFLLAIGLIYASLIVAKQMGAAGANQAMALTKAAVGKTTGAIAGAGRMTLGRGAQKMGENPDLLKKASQKGWRGTIARGQLKALDTVADSSFDARRVGGAGKKLGVGEGKKGGYKTRLTESGKDAVKFSERLGTDNKAKAAEATAYDKRIKIAADLVKEKKEDSEIADSQKEIDRLKIDLKAESDPAKRKDIITESNFYTEQIKIREEKIGLADAQNELKKLEQGKEKAVKIAGDVRKQDYANTLQTSGISVGSQGLNFAHQNQSDAKAIQDKLNKGKDDEILEKLGALSDKVDKGSE